MNATLIMALLVPWVFWGVLMGLLKMAGRSWINLVLIPIGISVVFLIVSGFTSASGVLWLSMLLHILLLLFFFVSFVRFLLAERKGSRDR